MFNAFFSQKSKWVPIGTLIEYIVLKILCIEIMGFCWNGIHVMARDTRIFGLFFCSYHSLMNCRFNFLSLVSLKFKFSHDSLVRFLEILMANENNIDISFENM